MLMGECAWLNPGGDGWSIILQYLGPALSALLSRGIVNGQQLAPLPIDHYRHSEWLLFHCYYQNRIEDFEWIIQKELQNASTLTEKEFFVMRWMRQCETHAPSPAGEYVEPFVLLLIRKLSSLWRIVGSDRSPKKQNAILRSLLDANNNKRPKIHNALLLVQQSIRHSSFF